MTVEFHSKIPASFRDPSGFLFQREGTLLRQVQENYREHYESLMQSGLYEELTREGLLIPHEERDLRLALTQNGVYKVIQPEVIPFVSYPYEWCFGQIKDAALLTLEIQKRALKYNMVLKDTSAFNVQFWKGRPVLIDTLSFETYVEGEPWVGYRQFCQHFLAPLCLMAYRDTRLHQLLRIFIDGVPLDLASRLLPRRTYLRFPLLLHLHLHAQSQKYFANKPARRTQRKLSRTAFLGLLDSLESAIRRLHWQSRGTEWGEYYDKTNYSQAGMEHKRKLIASFLDEIQPRILWDLGANDGFFSRIASDRGILTVAFDGDPACVEKNYQTVKERREETLLPLQLDWTNPTPGVGWENQERQPLLQRGPADAIFALAIIHHLAIGNNVPFDKIASFFSRLCRFLIIEFVPKSDSQVQKLLRSRCDIFADYSASSFEAAFHKFFRIRRSSPVTQSERTLYLMEK